MKEADPLSRAESLYRQALDGLDAVRRVGEILSDTFDETKICEHAVRIFVEHLPFENCSILLLVPPGNEMRLRAAAGKSDESLPPEVRRGFNKDLRIQVGEGVAGEVVQSGKARLVLQAGRDPSFKPFPSPIPIRSLLCLPIRAKNEVIGVINLSHPEIEEISIDQEKTLDVLSRMVGQAITISRLSFQLIGERLQRSERLITLGQLSASVAHEVNNPLTNIMLRAQKLRSADGLNDRDRGMAIEIEEESDKIASILGSVLDYSRSRESRARPIDVHRSLDRAFELTLPLLTERGRVRVEKELADELPLVHADPHHLEQIFTNLVTNALHAMERGGTIHVRSGVDEESRVFVRIRDTGPGIAEEDRDQIFDPFFTTRAEDNGTGLGLGISRQIAQELKGDLQLGPDQQNGAEFVLTLPAIGATKDAAPTAPTS